MPTRRSAPRARRPPRSGPEGRRGRRLLTAAAVAALGAALGLWLAGRLPLPSHPARRPSPPAPTPAAVRLPRPAPTVPSASRPPAARPRAAAPTPAPPAARAANVFDDAGGSLEDVEQIIAIGRPVTVAVLPGLPHSSEVARRAHAAGLEVLLHLPLEPEDGARALGPHGITVDMPDDAIRRTVRAALAAVPEAVGINNHMGSRGTADDRVMRAVLEVARERGLFFLDSRTTTRTVAAGVAERLGVRTASRTVFLDNVDDEEAIRAEVHRLISLARTRGEAIGIGHAQKLAPRVVAQMREAFDREGVALVPVSALVR